MKEGGTPAIERQALDSYIDEQMKDPEFKEEWNKLDAEFSLIESILKLDSELIITLQPLEKKT